MSKDTAAIRDQLGNDPETTFYLNADYYENLGIEEQSTIIHTKTLGHSWIVGSSTNGIVGANTGTQDGQQQLVGEYGRVTTLQRIVNPNNTFNEHFRDTTFKGSPCTANWDTTNFRLAMHTSNNHSTVYNTTATFSRIFYNQQTVSKAIVYATETRYTTTDVIAYWLSADGGLNWTEFPIGVETTFEYSGQDLRPRIIFFGQGGSDTYIKDLKIVYTI